MRIGLLYRRLVAVVFVVLLMGASLPALAQEGESGYRLEFPLTRFGDTLFTAVDASFRVMLDREGDVWYTTEAGLVHVDPEAPSRRVFSTVDGLPSSYALGLDVAGDTVYVGTDRGIGIVDRLSGEASSLTPANSDLPDAIVQEVRVVDDKLWAGTRFFGVAVWDPETDEWESFNTSTTTDYAKPVRRIVQGASGAVWVATEGDGVWKYDPTKGGITDEDAWSVLVRSDGLISMTVLSVVERGPNVYLGTDQGLQRWAPEFAGTDDEWLLYNEGTGMPDDRVLDLDVIPTSEDELDVFASTRNGVWQLNPETGQHVRRAQSFGILGEYIFDNTYVTNLGWAFATGSGVSLFRDGKWQYFATGPNHHRAPSPGPLDYHFTSASIRHSDQKLWFGTAEGVTGFVPSTGTWENYGYWADFPGGSKNPVNFVSVGGQTLWVGTNGGGFGLQWDADHEPNWVSLPETVGHFTYGLEEAYGDVWAAAFNRGLLRYNLTTGTTTEWNLTTLPAVDSILLTDVRVTENDVWVGADIGLIRIDRFSGVVKGTYTVEDGIPGSGVVFRAEPDGSVVWLAMQTGQVARFDVEQNRVTRVWDPDTVPDWPHDEADPQAAQVRALHREGSRLWAGTKLGLVMIDIPTGEATVFTTEDGLVQNTVNGLTSADGVLYIATLGGAARMDIATREFLPMMDRPDAPVDPGEDGDEFTSMAPGAVRVTIDSPRDRDIITGNVTVRGTAIAEDGEVARVEVKLGSGEWQVAEGTTNWHVEWNTAEATPDEQVVVRARAFVGERSSPEKEILVTPIELPEVPLEVETLQPSHAIAGRDLTLHARIGGVSPVATLYYQTSGAIGFTALPMHADGALWSATVPARDVRVGELKWYVEAESGRLRERDPADFRTPRSIMVEEPSRLAVSAAAPDAVEASAGEAATFAIEITNIGTEPGAFTIAASGLRASWVTLSRSSVDLEPGAGESVDVTFAPPAAAFADATELTFEVRDATGEATPATVVVPVTIAAEPTTDGSTTTGATTEGGAGANPVPLPAVVALAALALAARRRRAA